MRALSLVASTAAALLLAAASVSAQQCMGQLHKASCTSARPTNQASCEDLGCCWDWNDNACYYPLVNGYLYEESSESNAAAKIGRLTLRPPENSIFGDDIPYLTAKVVQQEAYRIHVKITDATAERWEVPGSVVPMPSDSEVVPAADMTTVINSLFSIAFIRPLAKTSFLTLQPDIVYKDQYIQFTLGFDPSAATYGLSESTREHQRLQVGSVYTMWNTDQPSSKFDASLYGSHPFFLQIANGQAFGVLLLNSNAMDVTYQQDHMIFQLTGGVIDLYVFAGNTPADVLAQYAMTVGFPAMPPYWSLGFHNCRWGYPDLAYVQDVVKNYTDAQIPLDTQWLDIDYMDAWKDFTFDEATYPVAEVAAWVNELHNDGMRFVPIVDPGIPLEVGYPAYDRGIDQDIFIKDRTGVDYYLGQVWPGPTYFPDWFHPNATSYWTRELQDFHNMVQYDGIWIDMNEIANFCNHDGNGQVCKMPEDGNCPTESQTACCLVCETVDATDSHDFPPFLPDVTAGSLGGKTISASSIHYGDVLEYNAHNLYGLMESTATKQALLQIKGTRPFVLSRSTFVSSGRHVFHWTGDNAATWEDLRASINTISTLSVMGMSMTGADICGFIDDTTEELCTRWIELGAFYPFSRNHNNEGNIPQELYRWPQVAEASRRVLKTRYELLPHLYTLLYRAHLNGEPVFAPLWMNFWTDPTAYDITEQFMWGTGILFSPVVRQGATAVNAYFPSSLWYNFYDSKIIDTTAAGKQLTLPTDILSTNIHVRGGTVIPMQGAAMTTAAARLTPFTLLVALDATGAAVGSLVVDDGEQPEIKVQAGGKTFFMMYTARSGNLNSKFTPLPFPAPTNFKLDTVRILGDSNAVNVLKNPCASISIDGSSTKLGSELVNITVAEDVSEIILGPGLDIQIVKNFDIYWAECESNDNDDADWWNDMDDGEKAGVTIAFVIGSVILLGGVALACQDFRRRRADRMHEPLMDKV